MHKLITFSAAASLLLAPTAPPVAAQTTVNKTWVSSTGTDSGTCQLAAPCRTFQFAHDQTSAGGEIDVKDSGAYGPIVITKAISIVADGVVASVGMGSSGYGIDVNAGDQDTVSIHSLTVSAHGKVGFYYHNCYVAVIDHSIFSGGRIGIWSNYGRV